MSVERLTSRVFGYIRIFCLDAALRVCVCSCQHSMCEKHLGRVLGDISHENTTARGRLERAANKNHCIRPYSTAQTTCTASRLEPSGHAAQFSKYRRNGNTERFGFIAAPNWFLPSAHLVIGGYDSSLLLLLPFSRTWTATISLQGHL